jgi:hypothetical protein
MRRIVSLLTAILAGALAVGIGMGIYLSKANQDRERLAQIAKTAEQAVTTIQEKQNQAIAETNKILEGANTEIAKAQNALKALEAEQALMATATVISPPKPSQLRGWKEAINIALGVSLKYPSQGTVATIDQKTLTLERASTNAVQTALSDSRWFSLVPWDERLEQELLSTLVSSTKVSYFTNGKLFIGTAGSLNANPATIFVLKTRSGSTNFLIWARDPDALPEHKTLFQVLSTLDFAP